MKYVTGMFIKIDRFNYRERGSVYIWAGFGKNLDYYNGEFRRIVSVITKELVSPR